MLIHPRWTKARIRYKAKARPLAIWRNNFNFLLNRSAIQEMGIDRKELIRRAENPIHPDVTW